MAQLIHYHFTDKFSFDDIKAMNSSGILFDNGLFMTFEECRKNFVRYYPESSGNCIAERNVTGFPQYYEFYTCGTSMLIQFDRPGSDRQNQFRQFGQRLRSYGFTTYDLS